jgi:hypothetical protein
VLVIFSPVLELVSGICSWLDSLFLI